MRTYQTYTIRTDGATAEFSAESMDRAAVEFAEGEGIRGVTDAESLMDAIDRMGGWCWIEDESGHRAESSRRH